MATFDWRDPRCILCLSAGGLTDEHIVPQMLGGILTCKFLCKPCNDRMGQIEARLKEAPDIRTAVEKLRAQIPGLYTSISKNQSFIAQSAGGIVHGKYRFQECGAISDFRVSAGEAPDGSLLLPSGDDIKKITRCLAKEGFEKEAINQALAQLNSLPFDSATEIAPGHLITKREATAIRPKLDARRSLTDMDSNGRERLKGAGICLLKIAFEYLGLHIRDAIYASELDPFREALLLNNPDLCDFEVDGGNATPAPFHGLLIVQSQPHPIVHIRFFGSVVNRIHFSGLRIAQSMPRIKYTHDLITGYEHGELQS